MIKRIVILIIVLLIGFTGTVIAAGALYRMTNPEYFPGDHDGMIVGQIVSLDQENFTVMVFKTINGSVDGENILVDKNFTYLGFSEEYRNPEVGDFCVISVKKYDGIYKLAYTDRAVKADSGNYKTLQCIYEEFKYQGGDVPAIQWYVNSGGTENGFAFGSGRVFVDRPNGERVDITDIAIKVNYDQSGNIVYYATGDKIIVNPQTGVPFNYSALAFTMLILGYLLLKYRKSLAENITE